MEEDEGGEKKGREGQSPLTKVKGKGKKSVERREEEVARLKEG